MQDPKSPIVHFYTFNADAEGRDSAIAVPDGCVDILFAIRDGAADGRVYGSVTHSLRLDFLSGADYFGVRFLPGYLPKRLDVSIPELIDSSVSLTEFEGGGELLERVACAHGFAERIDLMQRFIGGQWNADDLLHMMIADVVAHGGTMRVSELERDTQYSARYINRVFSDRLGLSPKAFSKFIRFQSLIGHLNEHRECRMTDLAVDSGYYDQSHFIKEFKEFASVTPREYARAIDLPSYYDKIVWIG
jgi:AraC-like DNA-binding protein